MHSWLLAVQLEVPQLASNHPGRSLLEGGWKQDFILNVPGIVFLSWLSSHAIWHCRLYLQWSRKTKPGKAQFVLPEKALVSSGNKNSNNQNLAIQWCNKTTVVPVVKIYGIISIYSFIFRSLSVFNIKMISCFSGSDAFRKENASRVRGDWPTVPNWRSLPPEAL